MSDYAGFDELCFALGKYRSMMEKTDHLPDLVKGRQACYDALEELLTEMEETHDRQR